MSVFANTKVGDPVVAVYALGERSERSRKTTVKSIGRKWITVKDGTKFHVEEGYGEYGWCLFPTEEAYTEARTRNDLWNKLHTMTYGSRIGAKIKYTTAALKAAVAALEENA